jgi:peptidoglycan/LPS O-acetylase OafA/YrhL
MLRITYATLCDKYARGGGFTARRPAFFAGRATFGLVLLHGLGTFFLFVLFSGSFPDISKRAFVGTGVGLFLVIALWLSIYVESDAAQRNVRELLVRESDADAAARRRTVEIFRWASFGVFIVLLVLATSAR